MMAPDVSVVICTYNRAYVLGNAIESLCRQALSTDRFEIIIIDNGSTDPTNEVINNYQAKYQDHNIRLLFESQQGLGYSRNRALIHAQGRYIAFLDDDARAAPHWLPYALCILYEHPDEFICLGGPIEPFYTSPKPDWFKDRYESRSLGSVRRKLEDRETFSGSNMIWDREQLLAIGGFDVNMGVKGMVLSLGEETMAFNKVWETLDKPRLLYVPELIVQHWVPAFKMKVSYRLKRAFVAGQVAVELNQDEPMWSHRLLGACKGFIFGGLKALWHFRRYEFWQNWATEEGQPIFINLGTILAMLGIYITVRQE